MKDKKPNKINSKCLSCNIEIEDTMKWCSMECKKQFLLDNYSPGCTIRAMQEYEEERLKKQKEFMKKVKESGLSVTDYILEGEK